MYKQYSKFGNRKTDMGGNRYDSKFEASVAHDLDLRLKAGDIKDYDKQYRVDIYAYTSDGKAVKLCSHKVDFRIHHHDGSFELMEAKGFETRDYRQRKKFLEQFWLPEHPDHEYTVVKQKG